MRSIIFILILVSLFQCSDESDVKEISEKDLIGTWILHTTPANFDWDTAYCVDNEPMCSINGTLMKCKDLAYQRVMYGYNFQSYTHLEPWEFMIANQFRVVRFGYEMEFADCNDNQIGWIAPDVERSPEDYPRHFIGHYTLQDRNLEVWASWVEDEPPVSFFIHDITDSTLTLTSNSITINFKKEK